MKLLITGGTGFIGSRLALKCLERGDSVTILGQENNSAEVQNRELVESKGGKFIFGSVTDRKQIYEAVNGIDLVFHLAAAQHEANIADQKFWDVNVVGTHNILEASAHAGVRRFVHGSTIGVYGPSTDGPVNEESALAPDNIYGVTKLEGEKLALSYGDILPVVITRISETYGPGDRRLLKLFNAVQHNMFFMIGAGKNIHHPIYIDDLTDALILAGTVEGAPGEVFVLAGKESLSTAEMVTIIASHLGKRISRIRVPLSGALLAAVVLERLLRPLGIQPPLHRRRLDFFKKSYLFTNSKSFRGLGFLPRISFQEGVKETALWYQKMGLLGGDGFSPTKPVENTREWEELYARDPLEETSRSRIELTAKIEPFDSFWEGPRNIEKGYSQFSKFYKYNYLTYIPRERSKRIFVTSCGPGYFVNLLKKEGYTSVLGIDSSPAKIAYARRRGLNCIVGHAFDYLEENVKPFDVIFVEQEINHLTKDEIVRFLKLCRENLKDGGMLILHSLNGANPITGAEALAQNFDHYNTFTEYSLRQILEYSDFRDIKVLPLNLYVFYSNPLNYVAMALHKVNSLIFTFNFKLYGKFNRIFTKKIAAICRKPHDEGDKVILEGLQRVDGRRVME